MNARQSEWELSLTVTDVDQETLARGLAAAKAVFDDAGVLPSEAAAAIFKLECEVEELTPRESAFADVWARAERAALETCRPGHPDNIFAGALELIKVAPVDRNRQRAVN